MLTNSHVLKMPENVEVDFSPVDLKQCIEKTRRSLETAYAGFNNAVDTEMIDSYIYEINSLQTRYNHLTKLAAREAAEQKESLDKHSPIRALVSHVLG